MDGHQYFWYVLFVKTNTEKRVIKSITHYIEKNQTKYKVEPFILESEQYYRNKKYQKLGSIYQKRPLFPGYVFIETDMLDLEFIRTFYDFINKSRDIIKLLSSKHQNKLAISDEEKTRLEYLCLGRRCINHSEGYIEGENIVIVTGPLVGKEGVIKRVNRHNRCADVELELLGQKQLIKVALEIIKKSIN